MKCLRARILAMVALVLLASGASATTIDVTTPLDIVAPNDELCSIREATAASEMGTAQFARSSGKILIDSNKSQLETALVGIQQDPVNNSYPHGALIALVQTMVDELATFDSTAFDAPLVDDVNDLKTTVVDLPGNAGAVTVQSTIALQVRVIAAIGKEVDRLINLQDIDGCKNGSAFDLILLKSETTYYLFGEINLKIATRLSGGDNVVIAPCDTNANCGGRPVPPPHRLFTVKLGATADFQLFTLMGGDAGLNDGGAVQVGGLLNATNVTFTNNKARNGGAVYVASTGSVALEKTVFIGNSASVDGGAVAVFGPSATISLSTIGRDNPGEGNTANTNGADAIDGRGGALFFAPTAIPPAVILLGNMTVDATSIAGNAAAYGSGIYVGGQTVSVTLTNVTIARNDASIMAALDVETSLSGAFKLNNVTIAENTGAVGPGGGTGGVRFTIVTGIEIWNSIIAANSGASTASGDADCEFSGLPIPQANFRRNYFQWVSASFGCLGAEAPTSTPDADNFELGLVQTMVGYLVEPFDADQGYYIPIYPIDVSSSIENRLVNRGSGALDVARCETHDQRSFERLSSVDSECDIGAIEYQVGRRVDDSVDGFVDERLCFDVISNDIGDSRYVAGSLRIVPNGVERPGAIAIVISRTPGSSPSVDPLLDLDDPSICPNQADISHTEAILFTSAPGSRGETNVTYGLQWTTDAVSLNPNCVMPVPGAVCGDVTARVRVETDIHSGITSSTMNLGGMAPVGLLAILLLAVRRRVTRRWLLACAVLCSSSLALSAENIIYVNSWLDEPEQTSPGDGKCTLREALNTARNDQANLTGGDCLDGNEGPDIIEFTPVFVDFDILHPTTTVELNGTLLSYGSVTIRCPAPATGVTAQVCTIRRSPLVPLVIPFRLFDSHGSLSITRMTVEGGTTSLIEATDGGAIFSTGSLAITDSIFRNNSAVSGGAIFLAGTRSSLSIIGSTFDSNLSVGTGNKGGGAIVTTGSDAHTVTINSSTFSNNQSISGAAALILNTSASIFVSNSTFSGNRSTQGPGAIDISGVKGAATLRNLTIVDNYSGLDPSLETWENPITPVPVQRAAIQTGLVSAVLTSSIVGANFDSSSGLINANCGPGTMRTVFNLFGDDDGVVPANIGSTCVGVASDQFVPATTLFNKLIPGLGYLTALLPVSTNTFMHSVNNPAAMSGIIVDAGFSATPLASSPNDDQVTAFELTEKCSTTDQRGASRASGNRCDRGAYEYIAVTAIADVGNNNSREDRIVVVDILKNDLFDNIDILTTNDIKQNCTVLDTLTLPGRVIWKDSLGLRCAVVDLGVASGDVTFLDPVVSPVDTGFTTDSGFVLRYDNHGVIANKDHAGVVVLRYQIYAVDGTPSNFAELKVSISNIPPRAYADTASVGVGASTTIDLLANDSDPDLPPGGKLRVTAIGGTDCDGVLDPLNPGFVLYYQCQFGRVWLDDATGVITWVPDNSFNPFTQQLTYSVTDDDPVEPEVSTATVTIRVNYPEVNGGGYFGKNDLSDKLGIDFLGAPGNLFFVSLLLSLLRRRKHARSRVLH